MVKPNSRNNIQDPDKDEILMKSNFDANVEASMPSSHSHPTQQFYLKNNPILEDCGIESLELLTADQTGNQFQPELEDQKMGAEFECEEDNSNVKDDYSTEEGSFLRLTIY